MSSVLGYVVVLGQESWRSDQRWTEMTRLRLQSDSVAAEREQARLLAVDAILAKTRFLANMSHALRSPLNAVIGAAQLFKAGELEPERQAQMVDAVERSGTNLLGLIDNILDLSRMEAGERALVSQDFHLFDCVDSALATIGLATRAKGLQLACVADPALAPWRCGMSASDPAQPAQPARQCVQVHARGGHLEPGPQPHGLRITVSDSGVGIPAAALKRIFEPFQQADDSTGRRFGGSGLGLTIVRQLVKALGGVMAVHSESGQGSEFTLTLPLLPARAAPPTPVSERWRMAYMEPHRPSADVLQALLIRMGCDAQRCATEQDVRSWVDALTDDQHGARLLVCADAPQTDAILAWAVERMGPERVIDMSAHESYLSDPARTVLARMVVKPVFRASLASRFVALIDRGDAVVSAPVALRPDPGATPPAAARVLVV